ncbi:hypothetical protein LINPERHAP1_LOCUS14868 [Linum perenne]
MSITLRYDRNVNLGLVNCFNKVGPYSFSLPELIIVFKCVNLYMDEKAIKNIVNLMTGIWTPEAQKHLILN